MALGTHQSTLFLKVKTSDTEDLTSSKGKTKGVKNRTASNFWMATLEARRQEINDLKVLRKKDFQDRILYPKSQNIVSSVSFKAAIGNASYRNKAIKENQENGF